MIWQIVSDSYGALWGKKSSLYFIESFVNDKVQPAFHVLYGYLTAYLMSAVFGGE